MGFGVPKEGEREEKQRVYNWDLDFCAAGVEWEFISRRGVMDWVAVVEYSRPGSRV